MAFATALRISSTRSRRGCSSTGNSLSTDLANVCAFSGWSANDLKLLQAYSIATGLEKGGTPQAKIGT